MVTTLKDGSEIRIYSFANPSSPKQPTHVATLHLTMPHDYRVLLELATTTSPSLAFPPTDVPFATVRNARAHVSTLHHDPAVHRGRWQPACFVVHNRMLIQYVDVYREEVSAVDVPWDHGSSYSRWDSSGSGQS